MGAGYSIKAKANSEADVYIYEDVGAGWFGGVTAKQFADDLKAIGDVTTINLRINSAGGDVFDGLAIYRLLVDHKAKVVTYVDGLAASIASVIAMAGSEINISEAGFMMIHDAWGLCMGNSADMQRMCDLLNTTSGSIADVYVARTKNTMADVRKWMADETWFTGKDAVENGFSENLVANMKVAARVDPEKHKFKRAPTAIVGRPNFEAAQARLDRMKAQVEQTRIKGIRAA
jgi:ATP-dependent Clp protease protease subunit